MKIDEIVTEGIIDKAKQLKAGVKGLSGGLSGAKAGWQSQGAKNAQTDKINKTAGLALQKWAEVAQSIETSTGRPPTASQAKKWFTEFSGQPAKRSPADMSDVGIKDWLTKEIANYMATKAIPATQRAQRTTPPTSSASTGTPPAAQQTPTPATGTPPTGSAANSMTSRMSQSSRPTPAAPQLAAGVTVTSREPLVFRYRGADYAVGDSGEWVSFGSNRPVSETLSRFLDSQEDIISRSPTSNNPTSSASTGTPPAAQQTPPTSSASTGTPPAAQQTPPTSSASTGTPPAAQQTPPAAQQTPPVDQNQQARRDRINQLWDQSNATTSSQQARRDRLRQQWQDETGTPAPQTPTQPGNQRQLSQTQSAINQRARRERLRQERLASQTTTNPPVS